MAGVEDIPGDPTPGQLAAADRRHAAVRVEVDRLVSQARLSGLGDGGRTEDWIRFAHGQVVDAVERMAGDRDGGLEAAAIGIAAEAVLRLARGRG